MPRPARRPPLAPPPPPLLAVPLYPTQVEALIEAASAAELRGWSGYRRGSLRRGLERLAAALRGVELHGGEAEVERLAALISGARSAPFRQLAGARVRELLSLALVWRAVEELPEGEAKRRLMALGAVDEPRWMADALDATSAAGLRVELPGEIRG